MGVINNKLQKNVFTLIPNKMHSYFEIILLCVCICIPLIAARERLGNEYTHNDVRITTWSSSSSGYEELYLMRYETNLSSRRRVDPISKHMNSLETTENQVMGPDGTQN
jgi:hypothetical protein